VISDRHARLLKMARLAAEYHGEQAKYGGASQEWHQRLQSFLGADVPLLVVEVEALEGLEATLRERARCPDCSSCAEAARFALDNLAHARRG